jgi:hypothetical protein
MLSRTTSITAVFTGLIFLGAVAGVAALAEYAPHELIPATALHFLISFFVAHFAIEGYSDEWERAGRPIPPGLVSIVALRYMILTLVLLVPLLLVAPWRDAGLATITTPTVAAVLLLVYVLVVLAAPPTLLVVSVSAASWGDLVSAEHWASRFRGRGGDFFLIYVVFVGALFCVLLAGLPIVSLAGMNGARAMMLTGAAVAVFATGFSISLLGRLCGSFAVVQTAAAAEKAPPTLHPSLSRFDRSDAGHSAPAGGTPTAAPAAAPRKTALLEAGAKVEALRARHAGDAAALAAALGELDAAFLPQPTVRQALVMALISAGRLQEAVAVAREAIPLCMRSGNVGAAALMCEALLETGDPLGLGNDQLNAIGETLKGMKRSTAAVDVYARVLRLDPTDVKAMKGTIAIAQELAQQKESAAMAVRIFDALIANCPGSPLLEFVKAERAKASRKTGADHSAM